MFDINKFGKHLYNLRKESGLTQLQLSKKLNVSRQTISKYEMGYSFPDIQILILLSDIFNKSIDKLVSCGGEDYTINSIISMAPIVKEDILNESLTLISHINKKINDDKINNSDKKMISKLMPFLDKSAKEKILDKVLKGEIDYDILYDLLPYSADMARVIETAVLDGAIEKEALNCIYENIKRQVRENKDSGSE